MDRDKLLDRLRSQPDGWDVIVIGGGATGLGAAVDAASRGYQTVLLEQADYAQGTSSRSTKLIHGGVRYLAQGNVSLVFEALRERGRLLANAPHLVHNLAVVLPSYSRWKRPYYGLGLKIYDLLAGKRSLGSSRFLSRKDTLERLPGVRKDGLRGGVLYHDGQFDDARLAIALALTASDHGAAVLNYVRVESLHKRNGRLCGVVARDLESNDVIRLQGKAVINATGVFVDNLRKEDDPDAHNMIQPSQGAHIVLDRSFMPAEDGLLIPKTKDGRVLFILPWHDRLLVGTTDTFVDGAVLEPRPLAEEIEYLLDHAGLYLERTPRSEDVLSTFAGLRPLVSDGRDADTASISRDHVIRVSPSGLITVTGGKWTTYRKMGEDAVDVAADHADLPARPSQTASLPIAQYHAPEQDCTQPASSADTASEIETTSEDAAGLLHERLPYQRSAVRIAVEREMARTVEDVLSRRTRALLLDARAAIECAPMVAREMAEFLGRDEVWIDDQVTSFEQLAADYLPPASADPAPVEITHETTSS